MDENASPPLSYSPPPGPPPPPLTPPPVLAPASPLPPRRRRGWMIFALVLLVLLGISLLYNVGSFFSKNLVHGKSLHARSVGPKLEEVIIEENDAANKLAVVEIEGIITSRNMEQGGYSLVDLIKAQLKHAEEDDKVKAVILKVDSPGGEVLASDEINRAISDFQK